MSPRLGKTKRIGRNQILGLIPATSPVLRRSAAIPGQRLSSYVRISDATIGIARPAWKSLKPGKSSMSNNAPSTQTGTQSSNRSRTKRNTERPSDALVLIDVGSGGCISPQLPSFQRLVLFQRRGAQETDLPHNEPPRMDRQSE